MLESNYGRSRLATQGNNHFGIKCHSDWSGQKIYHDDNHRNECFRSYRTAEESYRDHSDFLVQGSRYRELFSLRSSDYKGWAHGLKKAGYATDPKYPELLIRKIEEYRLWAYDGGSTSDVVAAQQKGTSQAGSSGGRETVKGTAGSTRTTATSSPDSTGLPAGGSIPAGQKPTGGNIQNSQNPTGGSVPAGQNPAVGNVAAGQQPAVENDTVRNEPAPARNNIARDADEPIKVISLSTGAKTMENNNVEYIIVAEGDTYESLAEKHQLLSWEITRYNDLAPGAPLLPGQIIYLQPKRTKAAQGLTLHTAAAGETMHGISQKYAIKLSSLYKLNLMDEGTECRPGQKLRLR